MKNMVKNQKCPPTHTHIPTPTQPPYSCKSYFGQSANVCFDVVKFKCTGGRGQIYKAHIRTHPARPDSENRPRKQTYTFTNSTAALLGYFCLILHICMYNQIKLYPTPLSSQYDCPIISISISNILDYGGATEARVCSGTEFLFHRVILFMKRILFSGSFVILVSFLHRRLA